MKLSFVFRSCGFMWVMLVGVMLAASLPVSAATQVVFLGTGTPLPDPERAGPATAVVVNGSAYLFDAGPGVVRRASEAVRKGVKELDSVNLKTAFITHLHSDHTTGLPDLIFTPWVMNRKEPLELYGPKGLRAMTDHILAAWKEDIDLRLHDLEHAMPNGYKVNVHEIRPGVVFKDQNVTITAFPVLHGVWKEAFGYTIRTADKTIVISGDARPSPALLDQCKGCDLLIHEVYTEGSTKKVPLEWQKYRRSYHTSTKELAEIANKTKPGILVLYHRANPGCDQVGADCGNSGSEEEMIGEIRQNYSGRVVAAHDLDIY
jgi:ribonuclease BN (tRNA processing enzyme)